MHIPGMIALDCETVESATLSLALLAGISVDDLSSRLASAPSFRSFEQNARGHGWDYDFALAALWRKVFGDLEPPVPPVAYWFHATRVLPGTTFSEGLLPLPDAVPRLVASLKEIGLKPSNERSYQSECHEEKMEWRGSWGPFGHLVRDAAFDVAQNHFFRAPEAVVDLGFDLDAYRAATVPCIVKFRAIDPSPDVFALAFYYVYRARWRKSADSHCSTTWGGEGRVVPAEDIVRVEFLDGAELSAIDNDVEEVKGWRATRRQRRTRQIA